MLIPISRGFSRIILGVIASLCMVVAAAPSIAGTVDDLTLLTEAYPPFNFEENGELKGISIDLMVKMLEKAGSSLNRDNIKLLPWARGYEQVQAQENVALFAMTRSAHREQLFKWVGPISPTVIGLNAKKAQGVEINSFDDIRNYRVGVIREGISPQLLIQGGIPKQSLQQVSTTLQNILKLERGRIDVWAYESNVASWEIKSKGLNPSDYEVVHVLQKGELWFAFNRQTPDSVIKSLQTAYEQLVNEGDYQRILDRYLK